MPGYSVMVEGAVYLTGSLFWKLAWDPCEDLDGYRLPLPLLDEVASPLSNVTTLTNAGDGPLHVPGFNNIPLNFELPSAFRFPHGLVDYRHALRVTKTEMAMLRLIQSITERRGWDIAILALDEDQLVEWYREATEGPEGFLITSAVWEWCHAELADKARQWQETGSVLVFDCSSAVCEADVSKSSQVGDGISLEDLSSQIASLGSQKDHDSPVVDPSLFPLIFDRTPVLVSGGRVNLVNLWEMKGQVADEVEFVSSDDKACDVRITSYVNNLHPDHNQTLYRQLESLMTSSVSSWNEVLFHANTRGRRPPRILTYGCEIHDYQKPVPFKWINPFPRWDDFYSTYEEWDARRLDALQYITGPEPPKWKQAKPKPRLVDNLLDELTPETRDAPKGINRRVRRKRTRLAWFDHPEPGISFYYQQWRRGQLTGNAIHPQRVENFPDPLHHDYTPVHLEETFQKQGLQVVVEISRIELTPDNPTSLGDSHFHTEGHRNDRIAATALYSVETNNITQPRISFEHEDKIHASEVECKVPEALATVFDVDDWGTFEETPPRARHTFGSVPLITGRLLSWPNTMRSKHEPFRLEDATRPGSLTLVKLRLVDPHYRICSTRNVPPQQHDWWVDAARDAMKLNTRLPLELVDLVLKETTPWPLSTAEARLVRERVRREHNRVRLMANACVGHHILLHLPYDDHMARDVRRWTDDYEST
ncbi:uncharacterized protein BDV14DRAFT_204038 [Aspergillus stella-maris]|uniref:uncharacterized protein n=1 Tax=Aspergillus stella-maris TaxID=1810926 RepID=UPI003CCD6B44